jgi:DNA-3-methyladenine glycosylase
MVSENNRIQLSHNIVPCPIPADFYDRDTCQTARDLLGCVVIHLTKDGLLAGEIVETEAYGPDDPANHANRGMTKRNTSMFGPPGHAYIYRIYGIYWCFNTVTRPKGIGEGVLIRALQPLVGIEQMSTNRNTENIRMLCKGPGRLCQAMGISGELNHTPLQKKPLWITTMDQFRMIMPSSVEMTLANSTRELPVVQTSRIGIKQAVHLPWRFYLADNPYVSRK